MSRLKVTYQRETDHLINLIINPKYHKDSADPKTLLQSLHKGFLLQENTCALLWSAHSTPPTSVYQKNIHKRKPTICKAEIWNPSLMMAFIIFPASPEEIHKRRYSILKNRIYNWKVFMPIYYLFSNQKKQCLHNAVRGSREQSWVHILYAFSKVTCWQFQTTKFHAAVEKNLYEKKVISEALLFSDQPQHTQLLQDQDLYF